MNENKIVYKEGLQLVSRHFNLRQSKKQDSIRFDADILLIKTERFTRYFILLINYPSKFHIVWDSSRSNEPNDGNGLLREMIVIIERVQWTV